MFPANPPPSLPLPSILCRDPNAYYLQTHLRNTFIHEGSLDGTDFTKVGLGQSLVWSGNALFFWPLSVDSVRVVCVMSVVFPQYSH